MILSTYIACAVLQGLLCTSLVTLALAQVIYVSNNVETKVIQSLNLGVAAVVLMWTIDPYSAFGIYPWQAQAVFTNVIELLILLSGTSIVTRIVAASFYAQHKQIPVFVRYLANALRFLMIIGYSLDLFRVIYTNSTKNHEWVHVAQIAIVTIFGGIAVHLVRTLLFEVRAMTDVEFSVSGAVKKNSPEIVRYLKVEKKLLRTFVLFILVIIANDIIQGMRFYSSVTNPQQNVFVEKGENNPSRLNIMDIVAPYMYITMICAWIYYLWGDLTSATGKKRGRRKQRQARLPNLRSPARRSVILRSERELPASATASNRVPRSARETKKELGSGGLPKSRPSSLFRTIVAKDVGASNRSSDVPIGRQSVSEKSDFTRPRGITQYQYETKMPFGRRIHGKFQSPGRVVSPPPATRARLSSPVFFSTRPRDGSQTAASVESAHTLNGTTSSYMEQGEHPNYKESGSSLHKNILSYRHQTNPGVTLSIGQLPRSSLQFPSNPSLAQESACMSASSNNLNRIGQLSPVDGFQNDEAIHRRMSSIATYKSNKTNRSSTVKFVE